VEISAILQATGGNTTGFEIDQAVVDELAAGKRPKVVATVNGHTWRTSIAPMSGSFWLGVSAANRSAARIAAGDQVTLDVTVDDAPRVVELPADFAAALADDPAARSTWGTLSFSHQRQHVLAIEDAKTPATRQRRIDAAVAKLRG
jgi:Bacteriocin-protection, YdeI or OmpD-Associated/Domain of unknown function (DUF1905)